VDAKSCLSSCYTRTSVRLSFIQRLVLPILFLASLSLSHILFFWLNDWLPLSPRALYWVIPAGLLIFVIIFLWYAFDGGRAGVFLACVTIVVIELVSLYYARGFNFSRLLYAHSFNLEISILFLPLLSYTLGRFLSLRLRRAPAQYAREPEQRGN